MFILHIINNNNNLNNYIRSVFLQNKYLTHLGHFKLFYGEILRLDGNVLKGERIENEKGQCGQHYLIK